MFLESGRHGPNYVTVSLLAISQPRLTSFSDIDFVIRRVDQAWDYFKQPGGINDVGQSDFAFLEQVEEDGMNATDLFDMLGDLFTNGTLGHFEDEVRKRRTRIRHWAFRGWVT